MSDEYVQPQPSVPLDQSLAATTQESDIAVESPPRRTPISVRTVASSIGRRLRQVDWTVWLLLAIALVSLLPRLYGLELG